MLLEFCFLSIGDITFLARDNVLPIDFDERLGSVEKVLVFLFSPAVLDGEAVGGVLRDIYKIFDGKYFFPNWVLFSLEK